jgi:hypothetical protein
MSEGEAVLLSEYNAPRACGECGGPATAYVHELGARCGDCHEAAPASRREGVRGGERDA